MAGAPPRLICDSRDLTDAGRAVRFETADGRPGIVIRWHGRIHGWVNACRHIPVELDLNDGDVFDLGGLHLVCSMHGARYNPDDGLCVSGPCKGARLAPLTCFEHDGKVYHADMIIQGE